MQKCVNINGHSHNFESLIILLHVFLIAFILGPFKQLCWKNDHYLFYRHVLSPVSFSFIFGLSNIDTILQHMKYQKWSLLYLSLGFEHATSLTRDSSNNHYAKDSYPLKHYLSLGMGHLQSLFMFNFVSLHQINVKTYQSRHPV